VVVDLRRLRVAHGVRQVDERRHRVPVDGDLLPTDLERAPVAAADLRRELAVGRHRELRVRVAEVPFARELHRVGLGEGLELHRGGEGCSVERERTGPRRPVGPPGLRVEGDADGVLADADLVERDVDLLEAVRVHGSQSLEDRIALEVPDALVRGVRPQLDLQDSTILRGEDHRPGLQLAPGDGDQERAAQHPREPSHW
jgi:hypothetical protein